MITTNTITQSEGLLSPIVRENADDATIGASDFQSFLTLLTAQLRHQDPLSPLDSTQFVEQLASFSAVEQQIETNARLETLASSLAASGLESATQWIGKGVEVVSGAARFDGEALNYRIPENGDGFAPVAVVSDLNGNIVYREALEAGRRSFAWSGQTEAGGVAPNGDYIVSVNYYEGDAAVDTKTPVALANVVEARLLDGAVKLVLSNGAFVEPGDIIAVSAAGDQTGLDVES